MYQRITRNIRDNSKSYPLKKLGMLACFDPAGNPRYLSNALRKLHHSAQRIPSNANPATLHRFFIYLPNDQKQNLWQGDFSGCGIRGQDFPTATCSSLFYRIS